MFQVNNVFIPVLLIALMGLIKFQNNKMKVNVINVAQLLSVYCLFDFCVRERAYVFMFCAYHCEFKIPFEFVSSRLNTTRNCHCFTLILCSFREIQFQIQLRFAI